MDGREVLRFKFHYRLWTPVYVEGQRVVRFHRPDSWCRRRPTWDMSVVDKSLVQGPLSGSTSTVTVVKHYEIFIISAVVECVRWSKLHVQFCRDYIHRN